MTDVVIETAPPTVVVVTIGGFGLTSDPDTQYPGGLAPPGNLEATSVTDTSLALTWTPSHDTDGNEAASYNIYEIVDSEDTLLDSVVSPPYSISGLDSGSSHTYRVTPVTAAGDEGTGSVLLVNLLVLVDDDTSPPSDPSNLAADPTTNGATITWDASTDPESGIGGYNVYLVVSGIDVFVTAVSEPSYSISGLDSGVAYTVKIEAENTVALVSNKVSVDFTTDTPGDVTPPTVPDNFNATGHTSSTISVAWDASTDDGSGLDYCEITSGFVVLATATGTSKTLTGLNPATKYTLNIRAVDKAGNRSAFAGAIQVTTDTAADTTPPTVPTNFRFGTVTQTSIELLWDASTDTESGIGGYDVYKGFSLIAQPTTNSHTVTDLTPNTSYSFNLKAFDVAGNRSLLAGVITTKTLNAAPKFNREFGLVTGSQATNAQVTEVFGAVDNPKCSVARREFSWPGVDGANAANTDPADYAMAGAISFFANVVAAGAQGHWGANYTAGPWQQTIDLGTGSATKGNDFIQLAAAPSAWTGHNGNWAGISIHGPGIPTSGAPVVLRAFGGGNRPVSTDGKKWYLDRGGAHFTLPAGGSGSYHLGGTNSSQRDWRLLPKCSASNTSTLEPAGRFVNRGVALLGTKIAMVELGNEMNGGVGNVPYPNMALAYRNFCHMYCGAKLANPNIIVLAPGTTDDTTPQYDYITPIEWYTALKAERTTNQPNYFSNLKASLGVTSTGSDPWDVITSHPYLVNPLGPSVLFNNLAAIDNMFNGQYPIMFTEQGCDWLASGGNAFPGSWPLSRAGAADWWQSIIDLSHGNVRWPHDPLAGSDGADLAKPTGDGTGGTITLANRRKAARRKFLPPTMFVIDPPTGNPVDEDKGMYDPNSGARKWNVSSPDGPIGFMHGYT